MNLIPLITFSKIILIYYFLYLGFFDNINKHLKLFLMLLISSSTSESPLIGVLNIKELSTGEKRSKKRAGVEVPILRKIEFGSVLTTIDTHRRHLCSVP